MSKDQKTRTPAAKGQLRVFACLTVTLLLLLIPAMPCLAEEIMPYLNGETGYCVLLDDRAGLLTDAELLQLTEDMKPVTEFGNAAFVTVSDNYMTARSFASDYCHEHFGTGSAVVFLIDMGNRELYIFSDGAIEKKIGKSGAETITDNVYRDATGGMYYKCAASAFEQIAKLGRDQRIAEPMKYIGNALTAALLSMLIMFVIVARRSRMRVSDKQLMKGTRIRVKADPDMTAAYMSSSSRKVASSSGGRSSGGGSSGGGSSRGGSSGSGGGHSF